MLSGSRGLNIPVAHLLSSLPPFIYSIRPPSPPRPMQTNPMSGAFLLPISLRSEELCHQSPTETYFQRSALTQKSLGTAPSVQRVPALLRGESHRDRIQDVRPSAKHLSGSHISEEAFMQLTWWLENVFIKQHTKTRLVDPIVTQCIADAEWPVLDSWFSLVFVQRQEQDRRRLLWSSEPGMGRGQTISFGHVLQDESQ